MAESVLPGDSNQPSYRRLATELAEQIRLGLYGADSALPTDTELMVEYGLGRQTVRRAFQELVSEGLVYRVRGRGTFPVQRSREGRSLRSTESIERLEEWSGTDMEVISELELRRDRTHADLLELDGPVIARLTVRRWFDDAPFAVTDIMLPPDLGNRLLTEDRIPSGRAPGTMIAIVGEIAGPVMSADETICAISISESTAATLQTAPGQPALQVQRIFRDGDGRPLEISSTVHASDRYQHRLSIHRAGQHRPVDPNVPPAGRSDHA